MAMWEMGDLFRQLGLSQKVNEFWAAARSGNAVLARTRLAEIEAVLKRTKNLRAAAGTLQRMQAALRVAMGAAEVAPEAAEAGYIMSAELSGELAAAETGTIAAEGLGAGAGGFALGPWGWAAIAILLILALTLAAKADEAPTKSSSTGKKKGNPFRDLPQELRNDPTINPVARLNQQAKRKLEEMKAYRKKHCLCARAHLFTVSLGSDPTGRELAMGDAPVIFPGSGGPGGRTGGPGSSGGGFPSGPAGHKPSGGRPDPFQFPQGGGVPMHPPGKGPKGETLPFHPPPRQCEWPKCPRGISEKTAV